MLKQILIDADTGIDDSIAILFALKRPDVRVMGVTTGFGNTTARQAAENSLRLIRLAGVPYEVPVAVGATEPLAGNWKGPDPHIHGPNGIGGVELPPSPQQPLEEPAWAFIARMAREHPGELTLVTLARMTNLAKALEIEPDLPRLLKRVVFMGGTFHAPGNVSPVAEANIAGDPEAADRVFQAGFDLTMVGLDVTHRVVLTRRDIAGWTGSGTMAGCAFASMVEHYIGSYEMNAPYLGGCALHDPLAVAVAIDPTLVGALGCNLRVDLLGEYRGRTICDEHRLSDPDKSALVALTVDAPRFLSEFKTRMARVLG